ncbi:hypothetical protein ACIQZB_33705 [Streptomyces sp. NPDC097727]|uniref:hypothetical protein n=1 Tax=Streptomyces sp. NPDC097727 TaxID=3366092 RepID=UPI0038037959
MFVSVVHQGAGGVAGCLRLTQWGGEGAAGQAAEPGFLQGLAGLEELLAGRDGDEAMGVAGREDDFRGG